MIELIEQNREEIAELCRAHRVLRLSIFGSAARATDFNPETSDIDLLVEFNSAEIENYARNYFAFQDSLTALFHRRVDLITDKPIENPFLRHTIEEDRRPLYAA